MQTLFEPYTTAIDFVLSEVNKDLTNVFRLLGVCDRDRRLVVMQRMKKIVNINV